MAYLVTLLERFGTSTVAQASDSFWMPPQASSVAYEVDWLFNFILLISLFFFLLIVVLMAVFVFRYRSGEGAGAAEGVDHNTALEVTWSIIPLIIVAVIFYMGFRGFMRMVIAPASSYEILVSAQKWEWLFTYPNGYVAADLHVPVDSPVELVMSSEDVIHSFYVPAFRIKRDVVPGRYNKIWFRAIEPGKFTIFCAEYCGTKHSDMTSLVVVHEPGEFEKWLDTAAAALASKAPAEAGGELYKTRGCASCHSIDGSVKIAPSFRNLFGSKQPLSDGSQLAVDENFIRESILDPRATIVLGFEPVMPTYRGRLKDWEITALIAFIKTLNE